jgi:hypothetical integral membrane protein (TIGR02206 family)
MKNNFQLFGPAHIAILCAIPAFAAVLALVQRRLFPGARGLRVGLAAAMLLEFATNYGYLYARGLQLFPSHLPLELCDASLVLIVVSLITLNPWVYDLAYYGALGGSTMALLTPELLEPWPSIGAAQFFLTHGLTVCATLYLVWSGLARPRRGSVAKAMVGVNVWAVVVGTFDFVFKTNYMYLRAKPSSASLLDFLGPWPWYIASSELVALGLFTLLYLPVRRRAVKPARVEELEVRR